MKQFAVLKCTFIFVFQLIIQVLPQAAATQTPTPTPIPFLREEPNRIFKATVTAEEIIALQDPRPDSVKKCLTPDGKPKTLKKGSEVNVTGRATYGGVNYLKIDFGTNSGGSECGGSFEGWIQEKLNQIDAVKLGMLPDFRALSKNAKQKLDITETPDPNSRVLCRVENGDAVMLRDDKIESASSSQTVDVRRTPGCKDEEIAKYKHTGYMQSKSVKQKGKRPARTSDLPYTPHEDDPSDIETEEEKGDDITEAAECKDCLSDEVSKGQWEQLNNMAVELTAEEKQLYKYCYQSKEEIFAVKRGRQPQKPSTAGLSTNAKMKIAMACIKQNIGGRGGQCYKYVKVALYSAGLVKDYPPGVPAKGAVPTLMKRGFKNITSQVKSIRDAPAGAVLVFSGGQYGHIEIKTAPSGQPGYYSDIHRKGNGDNGMQFGSTPGNTRKLIGVLVPT